MPRDPDWKPPWVDASQVHAAARLERLITGLRALQRYDCLVRDDRQRHQGTLRPEPDGLFFYVSDVQRLIADAADAQKG